jgi:gamma-glutamyltranspeptidase/glutathione hydrolase
MICQRTQSLSWMNRKRIAAIGFTALAAAAGLSGILYVVATREPSPIKLDPRIYDDYTGYYVFPNDFVITIKREGDRLMSRMPGSAPSQLFPETENQFFIKGNPARLIFHRNDNGQVDYAISRWKKIDEKAEKRLSPPVNPEGTNGMIAATTAGKAIEAGLAVLKEGGSAADAAMTTGICEVVHAAGSYVSFAGPMMMVYYEAASGQVYYLDAEYAVPLAEKKPVSIPSKGGRTALVPGFFAGVQAAHDRFGKLPFGRLFAPAIAMAAEGEIAGPVMEWWINSRKGVLSRYPETKRIFTKADGRFYGKDDVFRQPDLAETLRKVAAQGATYIYEGDWARRFVEVLQREGSRMTLEDMKRYHGIWEQPLRTTYRDFTVYAPTPWGGASILQGLNLLELAQLRQFGHYSTNAESLFWLMEISACEGLTRDIPLETRVSKQTAASIWEQMKNGQWKGLPKGMRNKTSNSPHTDGLVVVDQWGNMAVVNHTINTMLWGNTGLFVDGISIPDSARFQAGEIEQAGPGNRLPVGMAPLIVCRNGRPFLGSAATGGGLHARTLQVLVNILDFGMDPQEAVNMPAFVGWGAGRVEAGTFELEELQRLRQMGLNVEVVSRAQAGISRGYWTGILVDQATGRLKGGVSRGLEGGVVAY